VHESVFLARVLLHFIHLLLLVTGWTLDPRVLTMKPASHSFAARMMRCCKPAREHLCCLRVCVVSMSVLYLCLRCICVVSICVVLCCLSLPSSPSFSLLPSPFSLLPSPFSLSVCLFPPFSPFFIPSPPPTHRIGSHTSQPETVKDRLKTYQTETEPVLEFYQ